MGSLQAIGPAGNRSTNGGMSMHSHVNSGSIGTVETAAKRFNRLAPPTLSGTAGHQAAMERRLALLNKAMGNEVSPQRPAPSVPEHGTPLKARSPAAPLQPVLLMGTVCLMVVAGVLWLLLQGSRSTPVITPVDYSATAPVAAVVTPPAPAPQPPARTDEDNVRALVETWRQAWSSSDVNAYLGHYSAQFVPANGQPQAQWAASRRKIISSRSDIQVTTRDLRTERIDDRTMEVSFLQDYGAGAYRETAQPKTMRLQREDTGWRIVSEQTSPVGPASEP